MAPGVWAQRWHGAVVRALAYTAVAALAVSALVVAPSPAAHSADYPGQDQIDAAKAKVADAASTVGELDAAISDLENALEQADIAARIATEDYVEAQERSVEAQRQLFAANARADEADAALSQAQGDLASIARTSYRTGGELGQFGAVTRANGLDDLVVRNEAVTRATTGADTTVQRVRAAELVASTMRNYAQAAAEEAEAAEEAAREALDEAREAREELEDAVAEVEQTREEATVRLAELRQVSVALERERQAGLAEERRQRQQEQAQPPSNSGGSSGSSSGGSSSGSGSSGGSSGDSSDSGDSSTESGDSGGSSSDDSVGSSGGSDSGSGGWSSSAAQGQTAVNHALSLMGSDYQSGGNGPAYDCSGLTSAAWSAAGVNITRTSRSQYQNTTHVPLTSLSSLRKGDLIFWGSNKNPSNIYHVAIYIGGGKVAEASTHGVPAKTRTFWGGWAWGDVMPNAGRP